ncbi:D-Ala-D-Ala carboxypeptidase family metallohydrolase [Leptospira interrogans]|uniref:D-Ala-D-Ala carboxypeptidase family metallohydrolase n=1 Tax=Leptospira interrogans TaxID=173 RepID=UPI0002FF6233|nr:D-Ala-D-Ala carboxypeptidase family metallohydrolase [Leptospira interrogans]KAA1293786.1 peptidase M15 [Leptospira interrogans serovar Geyaweera]ULG85236.1 D-Ala-D-Ala carboxypeptidase family metallohydrolase [Leptospira interrogans]UML82659.1 D-Ala-D-Ala carboxypeptidase family metallohydrolase [Leptospira interrogans]UNE66407.1 D-Ala-D-Ala carboxypeptidase family metallohydrolase [Leptospira interrogans]UNE69235.1 D-Ala-D-Ala carboxypeptidase family metallohydrolase [Leptospira interroga
MNLSKNFTLSELTVTQTGLPNDPDERQIVNLKRLCETILEPLREAIGKPIGINSGFRSPAVNRKIKGSVTSQHMAGEAADLCVAGMSTLDVVKTIVSLNLPYHQLINEGMAGVTWVHVSVAPQGIKPKKEILNAFGSPGRMKYQRISIG